MDETNKNMWRRLTVETIAIVGSILLAFAIDAWWTEKTERDRTEELLVALESEWSTELERIDSNLADFERVIAGMVLMLEAHQAEPSSISADEAVTMIRSASGWSTYKASVAALNILLDYGLDHVDDSKLRLAIAAWPSELAEVIPEQHAIHELSLVRRRGEWARIAQDLQLPWAENKETNTFRWFGVDANEMAIAVIADVQANRAMRHELNMMDQYRRQLASIRETLSKNIDMLRNR